MTSNSAQPKIPENNEFVADLPQMLPRPQLMRQPKCWFVNGDDIEKQYRERKLQQPDIDSSDEDI